MTELMKLDSRRSKCQSTVIAKTYKTKPVVSNLIVDKSIIPLSDVSLQDSREENSLYIYHYTRGRSLQQQRESTTCIEISISKSSSRRTRRRGEGEGNTATTNIRRLTSRRIRGEGTHRSSFIFDETSAKGKLTMSPVSHKLTHCSYSFTYI